MDDYEIIDKNIPKRDMENKSANSGSSWKTWLAQKAILTLGKYSGTESKSSFNDTGKLTPKEFVAAGDYLNSNFPSWKWCKGTTKRSGLPTDKQYLVAHGVPCIPEELFNSSQITEDWGDIPDIVEDIKSLNLNSIELNDSFEGYIPDEPIRQSNTERHELDDDDIQSLNELNVEDDDDLVSDESAVIDTRVYDIYITYDNYYATPRVWLFGYDEDGAPLKGAEWQRDFSKQHVNKTVTFEGFPHENFSCATVHPCNHATAMLSVINTVKCGNKKLKVDVKLYLMIFLKIIQTIIPNIEFDFTGIFDARSLE